MKKCLVVLMLLTLLFTTVAVAASPAMDPNNVQQQSSFAPGTNNSNAALNSAVNSLSSYYSSYFINNWANKGATWLNNTSLSLFAGNNWTTLNYQFNTVQPLCGGDWLQTKSLGFWEVNVQGNGGDVTGNIGLGYRRLSDNKNAMMGANVFYDVGSLSNSYNSGDLTYRSAGATTLQQRVGVGVEYLQSYFEGHANYYLPVTSRQNLGTDQFFNYYQEALSGYDVAVSSAIPGAQWLKANVRGYQYFGDNTSQIIGSNSFLNGFDFSANAQITPQLALSGGYDTGLSSGYMKFSLNMLAMPVPALFGGDSTINDYSQLNLSNKMLNQVIRNNTIVVANEVASKSSLATVAVSILIADWNGNPVVNKSVTMFNTATGQSYTVTTNAQGYATFYIPKDNSVTAAAGISRGATIIWTVTCIVDQWNGMTWDSNVPMQMTVRVNTIRGIVNEADQPAPAPVAVVQPQPTPAQKAANVPPTPPAPRNPTLCNVSVVDTNGQPVAINSNFKVVFLDPARASSTASTLPNATIISSDLAHGMITFQAAVSPTAGGTNYETSGGYGVAVIPSTPVGNTIAYGNTINMTAYAGTTSSMVIVVDPAMVHRTVTVAVKNANGAPVADGTLVRAGSTIDVLNNTTYNPPAQATVGGNVTFTNMPVGSNFYVLAYTSSGTQETPIRTVIAVGQFAGLDQTVGTVNLTVRQLP
ncbi:MAG: inverse autotransporter beta domain-containing protein [Negativicutes bacterium]|jgi:hypothetical protein